MYKKYAFLTVFLISVIPSFTQDFRSIDSIINAEIQQKNIAGGVAYILHKNKVVLDKAYGYSDISSGKSMKTDDIFRIASQTKAIVSIAFLQLIEKNNISLDEPVEKFIPAFSNQKVAVIERDSFKLVDLERSITLRDLLTHQAGISSADEYPKFKPLFEKYKLNRSLNNGFNNLEEEVNQIAAMPLVHQPGARFSYGLCTNVLGRLIELMSKMPLDVYLNKHIFVPLKMKDTYFYLPNEKKQRLVKVYIKINKDSLTEVNPAQYPVNYPLASGSKYFSAIGGLVSTTHDYAKFLQCLLNNGISLDGKKIIGKPILEQFWSNQLGDKTFVFGGAKSLNNFGLGVGLTTKAGQIINHASEGSFFWGGAFNTAYMVDRKRELITLFYFQRTPFVLPPLLSKLEKTAIDIIDVFMSGKK
jgi:CubicO group peptidase (beta-lactamase class C family)